MLRRYHNTQNKQALAKVEKTLIQMRLGGIYDQVGFGFHRYSTDAQWLVPHFEKMLYDQAMLIMAYTEAYQATGKAFYAGVVDEIITYVLRDMTAAEGGFLSAEDADSEGVEGKFYLWTVQDIKNTLGQKDAELFIKAYNVKDGGNFQEAGPGANIDENILHLLKPLPELAQELGIAENRLRQSLEDSRQKQDTLAMLAALREPFIPQKVVLFRTEDPTTAADIADIAPFTRSMVTRNGLATAYVCQDFACRLPTTSVDQMLKSLTQDIGG